MGFSQKMVEKLFENPEQEIEDTNHVVELLIQGDNGWLHKPYPLDGKCQICDDILINHISYRQKLITHDHARENMDQELLSQLLNNNNTQQNLQNDLLRLLLEY